MGIEQVTGQALLEEAERIWRGGPAFATGDP